MIYGLIKDLQDFFNILQYNIYIRNIIFGLNIYNLFLNQQYNLIITILIQ